MKYIYRLKDYIYDKLYGIKANILDKNEQFKNYIDGIYKEFDNSLTKMKSISDNINNQIYRNNFKLKNTRRNFIRPYKNVVYDDTSLILETEYKNFSLLGTFIKCLKIIENQSIDESELCENISDFLIQFEKIYNFLNEILINTLNIHHPERYDDKQFKNNIKNLNKICYLLYIQIESAPLNSNFLQYFRDQFNEIEFSLENFTNNIKSYLSSKNINVMDRTFLDKNNEFSSSHYENVCHIQEKIEEIPIMDNYDMSDGKCVLEPITFL